MNIERLVKKRLVICNHADREECKDCSHGQIHARKNLGHKYCTEYGDCTEFTHNVRCVSINSKEGTRIVQYLMKKNGDL